MTHQDPTFFLMLKTHKSQFCCAKFLAVGIMVQLSSTRSVSYYLPWHFLFNFHLDLIKKMEPPVYYISLIKWIASADEANLCVMRTPIWSGLASRDIAYVLWARRNGNSIFVIELKDGFLQALFNSQCAFKKPCRWKVYFIIWMFFFCPIWNAEFSSTSVTKFVFF